MKNSKKKKREKEPQKPVKQPYRARIYVWITFVSLAIAIGLVIFYSLGFKSVPEPRPFSITLYLQDRAGGIALKNQGRVILLLDNNPVPSEIDAQGAADFKDIPPKFLDQEVTVFLDAIGWRFVGASNSTSCRLKENRVVLQIERNGRLDRLAGTVMDEEGQLIPGAKVVVQGLVAYTDINGLYTMEIPRDKQEDKQLITVEKEGFPPFQDYVQLDNPIKVVIVIKKGKVP